MTATSTSLRFFAFDEKKKGKIEPKVREEGCNSK
jgi:hypothetical protein